MCMIYKIYLVVAVAMFQKSILKQNGSVSKRRRVVFASVDNLDDGASSDSFSGLEVEVMCLDLFDLKA